MDIFEYAKEFNADYYDPNTGNIFKVQNYNNCKKLGIPTDGIEVVNLEGKTIGYVSENKK